MSTDNIAKWAPRAKSRAALADCRRRMASRRAVSRSQSSRITLSDRQIRANRYNAAAAASLWREQGFAGLTEIHQQLDRTEA
ncbi:MAG: hypothetical protein HOC74_10205 [Gemmatimonadetes bacterium]|nr:hypothetical protein [Gemmatimonadota bacterium]